jgi:hypothetical protein
MSIMSINSGFTTSAALALWSALSFVPATLPESTPDRARFPARTGVYESETLGWAGDYHVKSGSGEISSFEITLNPDGTTGTYEKKDKDGNTTDSGTITTAGPFALFDSTQGDCEGFFLEDEELAGHYTWIAICDRQVDGGLALKK